MEKFKVDDWVILDLKIGQVRRIQEDGIAEFSDGICCTSGNGLAERFRPLTLRNKVLVETFDYYYDQLRKIDGSAGFNFPDISRYFSSLALAAIDHEENVKEFQDKAAEFVRDAKSYTPVIQGVGLFRRAA